MKAVKLNELQLVCNTDDLVPGSGICALVGGRQIAVFYLPEMSPAVYAIGNWDPAGKANVLSRGIVADVGGELTVASLLYKHHFSLTTGQCLEEVALSVPVYETCFDSNQLFVRL